MKKDFSLLGTLIVFNILLLMTTIVILQFRDSDDKSQIDPNQAVGVSEPNSTIGTTLSIEEAHERGQGEK